MAKILIAEDNEKNLELFKTIIESLGYQILTARNGQEAIEIAKNETPDLILMDIQMPVMDGKSALKMLRCEEKTRNIPVIALTSYAMKGDREHCLKLGFADYISKPIELESFTETIKKTLER